MKNSMLFKIMKILSIILFSGIISELFFEYIISREVNGYLQVATFGVWVFINMWLGKVLYKLNLNK